MTLHDKIQALRRARGLSQEEVADALNVSRQAVSKWETGQSYPSTENLIALAALFESSADELLELARDEKTDAPETDGKKDDEPASVPVDSPEETAVGSENAETDDEPAPQKPDAPQSPTPGWIQKLWTGLKYALAVAGLAAFAIVVFEFVTGNGIFYRSNALAQPPLQSPTVSEEPYASAWPVPAASGDAPTVYQAFQSIQNEGATPQMRLLARETIFCSLEMLDWAVYSGFAARTQDGDAAMELCGWLSEQQSLTAEEVKYILLGGAGRTTLDGAYSDAYDAVLAHMLINYPQTFCEQLAAGELAEYEQAAVISGAAYGASGTEELLAQAQKALERSAVTAGSPAREVAEKLRAELELRQNETAASETSPTPEPTMQPIS